MSTESSLETIASLDWVKRWNEPVTLLLCSYFGAHYIHAAKEAYGVGFTNLLFAYREGIVVCYRLESDTEKVGKRLAEIFLKNKSSATIWEEELAEQTKRLMETVHQPTAWFLEPENYFAFEKQLSSYLPVFIRVNIVPDFLPSDVLAYASPALLKAREYSEPAYHEVEELFKRLTSEIAVKNNYPGGLLSNLLNTELREYLSALTLPSIEELREREKECGLFVNEAGNQILSAGELEKVEALIANHASSSSAYAGTPSSPGKAHGRVRIVTNPHTVADFNEGDILVTSMTNPDFLPLINKSGAVITEGGGILSHAAIVSRELRKPCILNVQNATRVFREGDMVEVDADKGTITVISHS